MTDDEMDETDLLTEAVEHRQHLCHATGTLGDLGRARGAVQRLFRKGMIVLWWHQHWTAPVGEDDLPPEELSGSRLESALNNLQNDQWWTAGADPESGYYAFTASEKGKKHYFTDQQVSNYMCNEWEIRATARGQLLSRTEEEKQQLSIEAARREISENSKRQKE